MRFPFRSIPRPDRQTRTALPSVAPHCELSFRFGFGRPSLTIIGRFWRANTTSDGIVVPPCQGMMFIRPFV